MTGFGRGEAVQGRYRVAVEARTVNHRFLDVALRLPRAAAACEEKLRGLVAARLSRGRVEIAVSVEQTEEGCRPVKVDRPLARGYREALEELRTDLALPGEVTLGLLLALPGVVAVEEATDPEALGAPLEEAAVGALREVVRMREAEGERLRADLALRLGAVGRAVDAIAERAPVVVEEYRARLKERLREVVGEIPVDEARLLQEVALVAERLSIAEEVVRLRSHLSGGSVLLAGEEAAVGRKFEFLLQEMNREINTIGSKGNDVELARQVIAVKAELEKMRELAQNVE
jgi:uncharacterized protein (TIGR00255 family)